MKQHLNGLFLACGLALAGATFTLFSVPGAFAQERGAVTGRLVPRFVSLKAVKGNVRRGPSLTQQIDWVYTRKDMPLQITAEYGHWRRVRDRDGVGGWVHYSLLSGVRTVIVEAEMLDLHMRADETSPVAATLESQVVARISSCTIDWCRLSAGGYKGWADKSLLWGVGPDEVLD